MVLVGSAKVWWSRLRFVFSALAGVRSRGDSHQGEGDRPDLAGARRVDWLRRAADAQYNEHEAVDPNPTNVPFRLIR